MIGSRVTPCTTEFKTMSATVATTIFFLFGLYVKEYWWEITSFDR